MKFSFLQLGMAEYGLIEAISSASSGGTGVEPPFSSGEFFLE